MRSIRSLRNFSSRYFARFLRLQSQVVVTSGQFHLHSFYFRGVRLLSIFRFFIFFVLVAAEVGDLGHRRNGVWRDLNEIKPKLISFLKSFLKSENAQILSFRSDHTKFPRFYLLIDARLLHRACRDVYYLLRGLL